MNEILFITWNELLQTATHMNMPLECTQFSTFDFTCYRGRIPQSSSHYALKYTPVVEEEQLN